MIPVEPPSEPPSFEERCRQRGQDWLEANGDQIGLVKKGEKRPPAFWTEFTSDLANGFQHLCAYGAIFEPSGTVDHYRSWRNYPQFTYEWSNYRFCSQWLNSSKGACDDRVLDPFEVGEDWFEILLPSLQLAMTDRVPVSKREKALFTLKRLHLIDDERVIRVRRAWLELYQAGDLTLAGLQRRAPLIAKAIAKQNSSSHSLKSL